MAETERRPGARVRVTSTGAATAGPGPSRPAGSRTVRDVDFALAGLAGRLSTRSVRLARMILIQASRNAMVHDLVVRNAADLAAVPTGKAGRPSKSLNLEQALAVLDAAKGERLWPYVAVSMLGGIRTEEARALRWSEVDLEAATVAVYRSVRRTGETKTEQSRRSRRAHRAASYPHRRRRAGPAVREPREDPRRRELNLLGFQLGCQDPESNG